MAVENNLHNKGDIFYLTIICLSSSLGGFLFGFDTAVASGTIGFLREQFHLNPAMEGWIMSAALYGSVIGAAFAGVLSDRFGRRRILILSAFLFMVSAVGCTLPETTKLLIFARLIGGVGVGIAAMVAPIFVSEISPPHLRGRMVSLYQFAITFGILSSYLSNTLLLSLSQHYSGAGDGFIQIVFVHEVWRGMFGSEIIPAALFLVLLMIVPESPRWLTKMGREKDAEMILKRVLGEAEMQKEMIEIRDMTSQKKGSVFELLQPGLRTALLIGIMLPVFNQLTGITTVMYYAPTIFERAGFQSASAFGSAAVIGFVNMIFTIVAIWKIDHFGRKPLLLVGFGALIIALGGIGWVFSRQTGIESSTILMVLFIFYIMFFAASLGPGVWVVPSEIYPTHIRGRGMSISTLTLFAGSSIVTQTFPLLREGIGMGNTFYIYGIMMIPALLFTWRVIPETKGKTLEEIQKYWLSRKRT
ncbi:sugar porter family MFS transporter [candidate division KSB1 bacterium]